ncbi:MAG TPA: sigma-70 family RNA polymerase sigma factor [Roseiflexaceae bacterium]|nr:sigma-70 family RNA polymerase sigma factor [Roseiflexaceae bacterium]
MSTAWQGHSVTAAAQPTDRQAAPDDQALLARVADGDSRALDLLYDRYSRVVYGVALRILGQADLAEDVVQETFWRVWRRSSTFQSGRGQVASWIFGIAHNLSVDELRRQRSRPRSVYDTEETPVLRDREDSRMDVAAEAIENERGRLINAALQQISAEQREAIELAYFGGLSQSEIAERLQSPIGTIKTRIRLGLRKLRDVLLAQNMRVEDVTD